MPGDGYSVLGVIDRAYRGAVEAQFFDALYGILDFRAMLSRVDLALRGGAVTLAVDEKYYRPELRLGTRVIDTLPDYRASVRALVDEKIRVFVDAQDLAALGLGAPDLVPGTECVDTNELARQWGTYDGVWFV